MELARNNRFEPNFETATFLNGVQEMKNLMSRIYNCEREQALKTIANGIVWASVILLGSWLSRGSENADAIFIILLTASTTAFLYSDRKLKNS